MGLALVYFFRSHITPPVLTYILNKLGIYDVEIEDLSLFSNRVEIGRLGFSWGEVEDLHLFFTLESLRSKTLTGLKARRVLVKIHSEPAPPSTQSNDLESKLAILSLPFPTAKIDELSVEVTNGYRAQLHGKLEYQQGEFISSGTLNLPELRKLKVIPYDFNAALKLNDSGAFSLLIKKISIKLFKGFVSLSSFTFSPSKKDYDLSLVLKNIDLESVLVAYPQSKVSGTGNLSGKIPLQIRNGKVSVSDGQLTAKSPGGKIIGDLSQWVAAHPDNEGIAITAAALKNFKYVSMTVGVDYDKDGKLNAQVALKGSNPDLKESRDVNLNITFEENIPALLETMRLIKEGPKGLVLPK